MIIKTLIKFILGISIISFTVWNRFLRVRENIELQVISLPYYKIIFILILIMFFLFIFYINLKKLFKLKQGLFLQNTRVQRTYFLMKEYMIDSPEYVYVRLTKYVSFKKFIEGPVSYFTAYCYCPRTIGIVLLSVPGAIVATVFAIDVIYFHELKYFFMSLNVLIPYIITKVLWFIVYRSSGRAIDFLELYLKFSDAPNDLLAIDLKPRDQLPCGDDMLTPEQAIERFTIMCNLWIINRRIQYYMTDIEAVRDHYNHYFQLYISSCYLMGWCVYLYIVFH